MYSLSLSIAVDSINWHSDDVDSLNWCMNAKPEDTEEPMTARQVAN